MNSTFLIRDTAKPEGTYVHPQIPTRANRDNAIREVIAARIKELAAELIRDYADKKPVFLPVMTGAFMFAADLMRAIRPPIKGMWVESIKAKSYFGTESCGTVKVNDINFDLKDRHVVLVEDMAVEDMMVMMVEVDVLVVCGGG